MAVGGAGGQLPSVTIEYHGIEIEADAQTGRDSVPSLPMAFWHFLKVSSLALLPQMPRSMLADGNLGY